jgi:HK97 family phage prohead protease
MEEKEIRGAIPSHSTDVVDQPWDGPGMVARLRNDEKASYYRKMFAWVDPDKDPNTKSAYKFPHHMVDTDGNIGAANVRACIAIIAALNGARGGADIPEKDRKPVWNHAARHLRDAGREPAELTSLDIKKEERSYEVRMVVEEADKRKIVGHAAVFNQLSLPLQFGIREKILPGAFKESIEEDDIRALWNHDEKWVLGRTKSGTLRLKEDDVGLYIEIDPPDTNYAKDFIELIKRGDVDQMSFGFTVIDEDYEKNNNQTIRILKKVRLFDVSPVTFPAYPQTDVKVRKILNNIGIDFEKLARAISGQETDYIKEVIKILEGYCVQENTYNLQILKRKLQLVEKEV